MGMKFTIITKDGSKWLRPVNVPYPNEDDQEEEGIFQLADAVLYKQMTADLLYIGSKPAGSTLDESEVTAITQARHKDYTGSDWFNVYDNGNWDYYQTRTAYTDAESHDRHIRPFNTQNIRPLVNQLVGEEISFSRVVELLNEIANGN